MREEKEERIRLPQHLLKERERARILRLAEPEHRLAPHVGLAMRARDTNQKRHPFLCRLSAKTAFFFTRRTNAARSVGLSRFIVL